MSREDSGIIHHEFREVDVCMEAADVIDALQKTNAEMEDALRTAWRRFELLGSGLKRLGFPDMLNGVSCEVGAAEIAEVLNTAAIRTGTAQLQPHELKSAVNEK